MTTTPLITFCFKPRSWRLGWYGERYPWRRWDVQWFCVGPVAMKIRRRRVG